MRSGKLDVCLRRVQRLPIGTSSNNACQHAAAGVPSRAHVSQTHRAVQINDLAAKSLAKAHTQAVTTCAHTQQTHISALAVIT